MEEQTKEPLCELNGTTLTVYWFMLRDNKPRSAREIQRKTGLSSSSLSLHHLNKLIELELVKTDKHGQYIVAKKVRTGILKLYVGIGSFFVPRVMVYASIASGFLGSYALFLLPNLGFQGMILFASLILFTIVLWIETTKVWKLQPF